MPFNQTEPYPTWNPSVTSCVPDIPNWTRSFGENDVSFEEGGKSCYVNLKKHRKKNIPCGDYLVLVTIPIANLVAHQITDKKFISLVKRQGNTNIEDLKILASGFCKNITIEQQVVDALLANTTLTDLCRTFIYYSWHRCIIEDRLYQQPHYGGQDTYLGIVK